jgi:hypothetical protein
MARHTYSEFNSRTAALLNIFGTEVVYRLNSLYDPNFSGIGTYPADYLEMKNLYASYFVHAVNIDVSFVNPSSDGLVVGAMVTPSSSATTLASMTLNEADSCPNSDIRFLNNTGMQSVRIQRRFTIAQIEGLKPAEVAGNSNYRSAIGTNPALTPWLRVAISNDGASAQPTCGVFVRLSFEAEWYDRIAQTD